MADFQDTIRTVKEKAGKACVKLDNAKDITVLTVNIKQKNAEIAKLCRKIGEIAYQQQTPIDGKVNELYAEIDKIKEQIASSEKQIASLKRGKKCKKCGKVLSKSYQFCPFCGETLEKEVAIETEGVSEAD